MITERGTMRKHTITVKNLVRRFYIDGERYGISAKNELFSLLSYSGRERIGYRIVDEKAYTRLMNSHWSTEKIG
jgi:hydroxylamine reductase (hybrid-cluster protein)